MFTEKVVKRVVRELRGGKISSNRAFRRLKNLPYETLSAARLDHHRSIRKGFPEAVYAPGKSFEQLEKIVLAMAHAHKCFLITRLEEFQFLRLKESVAGLKFVPEGRLAYYRKSAPFRKRRGTVAVITAGTADIPVAEEASATLELMDIQVKKFFDCGVAGLHRLFDQLRELQSAKAIICIAGMEGALPSVLAGLVDRPIVAVPASTGYGASFEGIAPLLTMLNSCAPGVAVVNIDNGYGAACFVRQMLGKSQ
ncbi:MAG: nickel pincer cofactor biosynthesis protein LarB [Candidatus Omnitrophica bacterium]|nr:nickel pincer cofactor biosynthesis protein LarB [Candidatus Omnitrophota bacterium]